MTVALQEETSFAKALPMMLDDAKTTPFFGWRVVAGAFVLAIFGWGLGFYGPPIYLHAVRAERGWSIGLVSTAITMHYLAGAIVIANLPRFYARFGLPLVTRAGALALASGLIGWASAAEPWQLFAASLLSGCGWVTMGAAAINAIVSPWFARLRPKALSTAYNGASIGGIIFSPVWVLLIDSVGFRYAVLIVSAIMLASVFWLTAFVFDRSPAERGQQPDGDEPSAPAAPNGKPAAAEGAGLSLWHSRKFVTLAAGMALGLFAQIGLLAHLFSLIVPALGSTLAGMIAGMATASAIAGRMAFGWLMPEDADRRSAAALSYGIQILGAVVLILSGTQSVPLIVAGVLLFGFGIGNATSLPPLIAQVEFAREDTSRVVSLIVAIGQATYAFAPAAFGLVRTFSASGPDDSLRASSVFIAAIVVQLLAIAAFLLGRSAKERPARSDVRHAP